MGLMPLSQYQGCGEGKALLPDASWKGGVMGNGIGALGPKPLHPLYHHGCKQRLFPAGSSMTQNVTQDQSSISVMEKEAASLDYVYEASSYGY